MSRFERQIILSGFGKEAQEKLSQAKVLVVGAGGLGCPVLMYLAAAGVENIAVVDGDTVALSNLNRQIIFSEKDVSRYKAEVAANYLKEKYSDIKAEAITAFLTTQNILDIISRYDLVIDGTDNFETRYMVNDACVLLNKTLVFGAIYKNEGQVAVFNLKDDNGIKTNYRDIFPSLPSSAEIPNCSETGVLGVLPGMIGMMMATEAIKLFTGYGKPLINKMIIYDLFYHSFYEMDILPNILSSNIPTTAEEFRKMDYRVACTSSVTVPAEVSWQEAIREKETRPDEVVLIDVRESDEEPKLNGVTYLQIPVQQLLSNAGEIQHFQTAYLFCQVGARSKYAAAGLQKQFPWKEIFSVEGGIAKLITIGKLNEYVS